MGYGLSSAIPTTLQIVAVFALGDASENKFHPVAVLPFMAFHGNASGQVNACAAVYETATITSGLLLLIKPGARLFVISKGLNSGNSVSSHKNPNSHSCLLLLKLLWLVGKHHLSSTPILYTSFGKLQARMTIFLRFFGKWKRHPCEAFNAIA